MQSAISVRCCSLGKGNDDDLSDEERGKGEAAEEAAAVCVTRPLDWFGRGRSSPPLPAPPPLDERILRRSSSCATTVPVALMR